MERGVWYMKHTTVGWNEKFCIPPVKRLCVICISSSNKFLSILFLSILFNSVMNMICFKNEFAILGLSNINSHIDQIVMNSRNLNCLLIWMKLKYYKQHGEYALLIHSDFIFVIVFDSSFPTLLSLTISSYWTTTFLTLCCSHSAPSTFSGYCKLFHSYMQYGLDTTYLGGRSGNF